MIKAREDQRHRAGDGMRRPKQRNPTGGLSLWTGRDPDSIGTARPPQRPTTPQTSPHPQRARGPAAAGPFYRGLLF